MKIFRKIKRAAKNVFSKSKNAVTLADMGIRKAAKEVEKETHIKEASKELNKAIDKACNKR